MTRLTDLDPFWLVKDGRRVGFSFVCPADSRWRQIVLAERVKTSEQWALTNAVRPHSAENTQTAGVSWTIAGGIENASFDTMTVTPSVDGSAGGLWHGWIRDGEARP